MKNKKQIGSIGGSACRDKHGVGYYSEMKRKWWKEFKGVREEMEKRKLVVKSVGGENIIKINKK